jgi:DNA transformation protein
MKARPALEHTKNKQPGEACAMAVSAEFADYLRELFEVVPGTEVRRMFGGLGAFRHGLMYALGTSQGRLAFKADERTIPEFEAEGCSEWVHMRATGREVRMGYWYAPERLLDDPEDFREWALAAYDAAIRADARKPPAQRKMKRD